MVQSVFIYLKHNMIDFYRFFSFSYIYICVCVCVCVYACMYVCLYVCMYVCMKKIKLYYINKERNPFC